jgi:uncharacterized Fe-S cluster-containing radical SAM superfamily protein
MIRITQLGGGVMVQLLSFIPDLIVEVTSVCNRSCAGCYAPNLLSNRSPKQLLLENPELFLNPTHLAGALDFLTAGQSLPLDVIGIRGGEPSLHPELEQILKVVQPYGERIFLETHGRWLLPRVESQPVLSSESIALLEVCRGLGVHLKISFDQMHGLSPVLLREMLQTATRFQVNWWIAITETSEKLDQFFKKCDWLPVSKVYFQEKAFAADELVVPGVGVVHTNGSTSKGLKCRFSPKPPNRNEAIENRC